MSFWTFVSRVYAEIRNRPEKSFRIIVEEPECHVAARAQKSTHAVAAGFWVSAASVVVVYVQRGLFGLRDAAECASPLLPGQDCSPVLRSEPVQIPEPLFGDAVSAAAVAFLVLRLPHEGQARKAYRIVTWTPSHGLAEKVHVVSRVG